MALIGKQLEPGQRPEHWKVKCETMPGEGKAKVRKTITESTGESEGESLRDSNARVGAHNAADESAASTAQTRVGLMGIVVISIAIVGLIGL